MDELKSVVIPEAYLKAFQAVTANEKMTVTEDGVKKEAPVTPSRITAKLAKNYMPEDMAVDGTVLRYYLKCYKAQNQREGKLATFVKAVEEAVNALHGFEALPEESGFDEALRPIYERLGKALNDFQTSKQTN